MEYLTVSEAGSAPLHPEQPASVAVDYAHVALARTRALRAYALLGEDGADPATRIAGLEQGVRELCGAVEDLVAVLTEVVSGLDVRDVHVVNRPGEHAQR